MLVFWDPGMIAYLAPWPPAAPGLILQQMPTQARTKQQLVYATTKAESGLFPNDIITPHYAEIVCSDEWAVQPEDYCVHKKTPELKEMSEVDRNTSNVTALCIWFMFLWQFFCLLEEIDRW
jgi:hypothetical protein